MAVTEEEVRQVIKEAFKEANVDQVIQQGQRVYGIIVAPEFEGHDVTERNALVTERVRNVLGRRAHNLGFLLPMAPGEQF